MNSANNNDCWDYIIVGAGSAGCVLANRLSANPNVNVLLLEAGHGFYDNILTRMPAGLMYLEGNPLFDWCYMMEPSTAIENRRERLSAGRVVGGGGTINGMVYLRGHPADYDGWAQAGCPGWGFADVLPYFKKIEKTRLGDDEFHGRAGLLGVETPQDVMPVSKAFIAAARQAGMPLSDDINGPAPEGVAITPNSIWRGVLQSTAIAYLRPVLRRSNLKMVTHALTTSLVMEGKNVRGVRYLHGGTLKTATARREVLLAAGAVRTPQILMLSGIGPAEHLRTFGIDVVHDAPNVGQNLQDHPAIYLVHETTQRTWNQDLSLLGKFLHGGRWLLTKGGPAASGPSQAVAFARSSSHTPRPDIQLTFAPVGYLYEGNTNAPTIMIAEKAADLAGGRPSL